MASIALCGGSPDGFQAPIAVITVTTIQVVEFYSSDFIEWKCFFV